MILQWYAVSLPSTIIIGLVAAKLYAPASPALQMWYMQKLFVVVGLAGGSVIHIAIFGTPAVEAVHENVVRPLFPERFDFQPGVILSFLVCFLAVGASQVGTLEPVGRMVEADHMAGHIRRGQIPGDIQHDSRRHGRACHFHSGAHRLQEEAGTGRVKYRRAASGDRAGWQS